MSIRELVGFLLEDEVVRISRRGCEHDDHGNEPVFEQTGQRGVERTVAGEEAGVRQDTFAAELLGEARSAEALADFARDLPVTGGRADRLLERVAQHLPDAETVPGALPTPAAEAGGPHG